MVGRRGGPYRRPLERRASTAPWSAGASSSLASGPAPPAVAACRRGGGAVPGRRGGRAGALLGGAGPGVVAGLSDDDPAGIPPYSILGAKFGYRLLWVLAVSTL